MLTHGIFPTSAVASTYVVNRHTPSVQFRVYRVTQLRTDGVHCRESAGTGQVVLLYGILALKSGSSIGGAVVVTKKRGIRTYRRISTEPPPPLITQQKCLLCRSICHAPRIPRFAGPTISRCGARRATCSAPNVKSRGEYIDSTVHL